MDGSLKVALLLATDPAEGDDKQVEEALGILKDEKEFEEFEKEDWAPYEEDAADLQVWDIKWDGESDVNDQFTEYLRAELAKLGFEAPSS